MESPFKLFVLYRDKLFCSHKLLLLCQWAILKVCVIVQRKYGLESTWLSPAHDYYCRIILLAPSSHAQSCLPFLWLTYSRGISSQWTFQSWNSADVISPQRGPALQAWLALHGEMGVEVGGFLVWHLNQVGAHQGLRASCCSSAQPSGEGEGALNICEYVIECCSCNWRFQCSLCALHLQN